MYFREFQRVNQELFEAGKESQTLKVAVTFSLNASNNDSMVATNKGLHEAMQVYNDTFGTKFGLDNVSGYTEDVTSRLNKTAADGQFLDLVIVIDQLLTGFDAPELNALYVDRTLKGAGLIQAYSRTNRVSDMQEKPWGRVVNYRWPAQNEKLMNKALAIYANKDSAKLSDKELHEQNKEDGITAPEFRELFNKVKQIVQTLSEMTDSFTQLPPSEKKKEKMLELLQNYNAGMAKLKQYDYNPDSDVVEGFDYDNPDALIEALGMTSTQEVMLPTVLTNELKTHLSKAKKIHFYQIELRMTHIKDVQVDYDYLTELVEALLNQVHEGRIEEAEATQEKINQFANGLDDRSYAQQIMDAADMIIKGHFPPAGSEFHYPAKLNEDDSKSIIQEASIISLDRTLLDFRLKWGITDVITSSQMRQLFSRHRFGQQDLDDTGQIQDIVTQASSNYKVMASDDAVQALSKIKYRNSLRQAIYQLADDLVEK